MKKSSYQKLKDENHKLRNQLVTLANFPDTQKAVMIKTEWQMKYGLEQAVLFGSPHNHLIIPKSQKKPFLRKLLNSLNK